MYLYIHSFTHSLIKKTNIHLQSLISHSTYSLQSRRMHILPPELFLILCRNFGEKGKKRLMVFSGFNYTAIFYTSDCSLPKIPLWSSLFLSTMIPLFLIGPFQSFWQASYLFTCCSQKPDLWSSYSTQTLDYLMRSWGFKNYLYSLDRKFATSKNFQSSDSHI